MKYPVLTRNARNLARSAAVVAVASVAAGCSSDAMRFQDIMTTGATPNQRSVMANSQNYPGGLDATTTGTIAGNRAGNGMRVEPSASVGQGGYGAGQVVASAPQSQPYPSQAYPAPSYPQVQRQQMPDVQRQPMPSSLPATDQTTTGSTVRQLPPVAAPQAPAAPRAQPASNSAGGWNRAGGTQINVREGETVYNLSRRYGVPVNSILQANGMSNASQLSAGQQIIIPTYVYSQNAPTSMPDSNPDVALAKSSRGMKTDVDPARAPTPGQAPAERVAVLPQAPRATGEQPRPATAPAPQSPGVGANVYTVASGDTLSSIARRTGASTTAIKQANGLEGGVLRVGQKLNIPQGAAVVAASAPATQPQPAAARAVDPAPTATIPPKATPATPTKPAESVIQQASREEADAPNATGIGKMRWPARGRVVAGYGASSGGKRNDGIDISLPEGTAVKAAENGVVIYAGDGLKEFGNTVLVRHENGLVTVYGHASEIKVKRGETVRRGQDIARSGMSGNAEQPKLHFEVRKDSSPVDPAKYLE